jgi:hypothetical protein
MLAISVTVILGAVDINDTRGYYHCSNGPKYARGYNDLSLIAIVAFCSSDCSCEIKCHPDLNGTSTLGAILILSSANIITYIKTLGANRPAIPAMSPFSFWSSEFLRQ